MPRPLALLPRSASLLLLALPGALACGGHSFSPGSASAPDAAAPVVGPRSPFCPATAPTVGSACSHEGLTCEYGDDDDIFCNEEVACYGGSWSAPHNFADDGPGLEKCGVPPVAASPPVGCPPPAFITPDDACEAVVFECPHADMVCDCDCTASSAECKAQGTTWHCFAAAPPCPAPRPSVGAPCDTEGEACGPRGYSECGQLVLACESGAWTISSVACSQ